MQKVAAALLAVLLVLCGAAAGCAKQEGEREPVEQTEPLTDGTQAAAPVTLTALRLGGVEIADFRIIYAESEWTSAVQTYGDALRFVPDCDRLTAERLAGVIREAVGVEIPVAKDTETEPTAHEILVGGTNRGVGAEISDPDSYLVALTDGKLTVRGGAPGTTWHAVDAIAEWLEKQRAAGTQEPDFASGSRLRGSYRLKKIACVGDSITYGSESSDPVLFSYPSVLGRILWQECLVYNFGHGSRTVRDDAERYNRDLGGTENCGYRNSNTYKRLMASTVRFDLVLLMLGTNDSYLVPGDWTAADDAKFLSCLRGLVDDIRGHNRNAQIVLMNCPTYFGSSGWSKPHTRDLQKTCAEQMAADGYPVRLYNMCLFTEQEMGRRMFADGLHPNNRGYAAMAEGVSELVRAVLEGGENPYLIPLGNS